VHIIPNLSSSHLSLGISLCLSERVLKHEAPDWPRSPHHSELAIWTFAHDDVIKIIRIDRRMKFMETPIVTKNCTICRQEKPFSSFNKDKNKKLGLEARCRDCAIKSGIEYRKKRKASGEKYIPRDPERTRRLAKDWRRENPARVKATSKRCLLKKKYGLSIHDYTKMKKNQNFKCAICERDESLFKKRIVC
jgi:hypothetical protein